MNKEFIEIVSDILYSDNFQKMKNYIHHGNVSAYRHSVAVAYACFLYYKKKNPKYDIKEFVRGAILHDYYLYDWHHTGEGHRLHGLRHPRFSYNNAKKEYEITPMMKDMILHHMFPLVPIPPHTRAGWVLQHIDKKMSRKDYKKSKASK